MNFLTKKLTQMWEFYSDSEYQNVGISAKRRNEKLEFEQLAELTFFAELLTQNRNFAKHEL